MQVISLFEVILLMIPTISFLIGKPRARGMHLLSSLALPTALIVMMAALQCRWLGLISMETGLIVIVISHVFSATVFLITNQQAIKGRCLLTAKEKDILDVKPAIAAQRSLNE